MFFVDDIRSSRWCPAKSPKAYFTNKNPQVDTVSESINDRAYKPTSLKGTTQEYLKCFTKFSQPHGMNA